MSRYKVRYLTGAIQRDLGLAVRLRRSEPQEGGDCADCAPNIEGVYWADIGGAWTLPSPVTMDYLFAHPALRILGDLCGCAVTWDIQVEEGANTYTFADGAWSPAPPWGSTSPLFFGDGVAFPSSLLDWLTYNAATLTVVPTVCDLALDPAIATSEGA